MKRPFPLGLPEEFGLRGAVFTDFGTLFGASKDGAANFQDEASLRASVGASVLWSSPLGPLRFDFAEAILKEDFDKTEFFRFSLGYSVLAHATLAPQSSNVRR